MSLICHACGTPLAAKEEPQCPENKRCVKVVDPEYYVVVHSNKAIGIACSLDCAGAVEEETGEKCEIIRIPPATTSFFLLSCDKNCGRCGISGTIIDEL